MKTLSIKGLVAVAVAVGALAAPAEAAFKLSVDTTGVVGAGATVLIEDNQAGDTNALAGVITWSGNVGGFNVLVSVGQSKPVIGNAGLSALDSNFTVTNAGGAGGTVTFGLTDTGFSAGFPGSATSSIGGTSAGTVTAFAYYSTANTEFGQTTLIASHGPFGVGAYSGAGSSAGPGSTPFSLTSVVNVTHAPGTANTTTGDHNILVPEPASLVLLGFGLLGLGAARRRQMR